ncbi:MAG: beta-lactamase family protein [Chloroflexota bacterium]|nr:beta-lactamase family protein [Chloroflexota bacterium]
MRPSPFPTSPFTRRRVLSLAAGGAALAVTAVPSRRSAAQVTPVASPSAVGTPVAGAATAPPLPMPSTLAADASPEFRTVVEALVAAMREHQVPGAAIGLLAGDREEHATVGLASLSSMRPVTPETLFQIGSLAKTFTGTAIWRLIDEGALAIDAPVRTYIPELTLVDEDVAAEVTVANLLDHSAGFYGDEGFDTGNDDDAIARYVAERLPQLPQLFPLGAFFSYNNAAFTLLGRLIEVATGTTYNAAMEHLLLGPLGLEDSLLDHDAVRQRPYADGHVFMPINGKPALAVQTPLWLPRSVDPAGGIWATTRDVIRYGRFHMDSGTASGVANVVSPDSLLQMREPAMPVPGTPMQMGRDWFVQDAAGERVFFHGGDTLAQHTDFFAIPGQRFALVVLTNGQGGGSAAAVAALNAALAQFPALAPLVGQIGITRSLIVPSDAPTVTLPADEVADYAGRYADPGVVITLVEKGEGLEGSTAMIQQPLSWQPALLPPTAPPAPVTFLAKDIGVMNGARLPFVRDAEGRIGWVSSGLRLVPRVDVEA